MARPKKAQSDRMDNTLRIRMTAQEKALIAEVAMSESLEVSAWARRTLVLAAKKLRRNMVDTQEIEVIRSNQKRDQDR